MGLEFLAIEKQQRINEQIRISPVRVISADGAQLGIIPTDDALSEARTAGLDLVEGAPKEIKGGVAKKEAEEFNVIIAKGRFRYFYDREDTFFECFEDNFKLANPDCSCNHAYDDCIL